jgi:hypothetical protein
VYGGQDLRHGQIAEPIQKPHDRRKCIIPARRGSARIDHETIIKLAGRRGHVHSFHVCVEQARDASKSLYNILEVVHPIKATRHHSSKAWWSKLVWEEFWISGEWI